MTAIDALLVVSADGPTRLLRARPSCSAACGLCGLNKAVVSGERVPDTAQHTLAVRLQLPGMSIVLMALMLYGVPLLGLLAGAVLAAALGADDLLAACAAVLGCVLALVLGCRTHALEQYALDAVHCGISNGALGESARLDPDRPLGNG